ncbi:MAG: type I polyketide synthase [Rhodothermales bacterium]
MDGIAIIGMSGRFPGANDVKGFWKNLVNGVNSIVPIPDEEMELSAADRAFLADNPNFVQKGAVVKQADHFDAAFFGIYPKEAQAMDPQHRLFLECSWEAVEDAGYIPSTYDGSIGVYAGSYMNTYTLCSLETNPAFIASLANSFHGGVLQNELGNDKDYMSTRVSFKLNLRGPSLTIQTACSTSLVSVAQACMSLSNYQCDMALAGGSTLKLPQNRGYLYETDGMVSPDGNIRTFDAKAQGTVFGNGVAVVLLKRLEDAIADGDSVYAVIKGWGVNNDGASKVGYTAPSVDGQTEAIALAQAVADIDPRTISYIEAHGTGTPKGDPIEVDALTKAFQLKTDDKQFCRIGSLKPNIGHLDVAAGVAGLMKTSLALQNKVIPPTLNFETPNPNIDFENTPFVVNDELTDWDTEHLPRRAGVSSFGVGGTNAHVVVEEAPEVDIDVSKRPYHIIPLSARSSTAADAMLDRLQAHLKETPEASLADVAYTLQLGRQTFNHSRLFVAKDVEDALSILEARDAKSIFSRQQVRRNRSAVFMFPGQGSQHIRMGGDLYENEPVYRAAIDECAAILKPLLGFEIRDLLYPSKAKEKEAKAKINQTMVAQPGIFATSYALAKLWMHRGITPRAMIGHSVGEFVAACLAGIYTLEEGLKLVTLRGKLMQDMPGGSMMAVRAAVADIEKHLGKDIDIAAVNSPAMCVLSGPTAAIEKLQQTLESAEIICRPLHTSHAFHSAMMEAAVPPFAEAVKDINLKAPEIPIMSSVHATWLTDEEATNPDYWARHLRETVRFSDAISEIAKESNDVFLEVGPGQTLSTLARQHPDTGEKQDFFSSLPHVQQTTSAFKHAAEIMGKLWQVGISVDWHSNFTNESRLRIHLPTYPFERKRFWFDEDKEAVSVSTNGHHEATQKNNGGKTNGSQPALVHDTATASGPNNGQQVTQVTQVQSPHLNQEQRQLIEQQLQVMTQQLQAWRNLLND